MYDWARKGVVAPSLSGVRPKRWSCADLMALRIIHWLRHPKDHQELRYPASPMPEVTRALNELQELGLDIWSDGAGAARSPLLVDRRGKVIVVDPTAHQQIVARDRWVIDGDAANKDLRLARADTVVFVDLPRWRCILGLVQRHLRNAYDYPEACRARGAGSSSWLDGSGRPGRPSAAHL